jgi:preprotein translocase subunit SecG
MILALVTFVHVIVCLFLIAVVLLQSGASADLAAFAGGLGSQTAFGPRAGANLLTKLTTTAAIIFMITSFTLAVLSVRHGGAAGSVLDGTTKSAPAKSAPASK